MIRSNQFGAGIAKSARLVSFILMISSSALVQVHGQDLVGDWTSGITAYSNSNCDGEALLLEQVRRFILPPLEQL